MNISGLSELHRASLILLFALLAILGSRCMFHCILTRRKKFRLPPGPLGLPLVGNLPFLGPKLHHRFDEYSRAYGPIVKLKLGSKLWIVISSPEIAKQVYKDNDIIFSNHDQPIAARVISYEGSNLVRSPYGPKWRMLRRVFLHELLNNKNLDSFSTRRQEEVDRMVRELYTKRSSPINVGEQAFAAFLNLLTSMLWGGTLEWEGNGAGFRQVVIEAVELLGRPNVSDFIPMLAWFDLQRIEREIKKRVLWLDKLYDSIIDERMKLVAVGEKNCSQDFLSILLKIKEDAKIPLTMTNLKGLIMDIMVGGTSVTSSTVEWVMAELMHRPEIKQKAQEELEKVVGQNHTVNESHIPKLHYLRAVIKESLRHHAVVPLLVPRVPSQTCVVGGYLIPEGARVVTNVWAIHMNPEFWENPSEFQPERFLNAKSIREFSFFPFGSGRRRCAGLPLVERMLPLVVATLLHAFEWRLPEGVEFDLCERPGVTLTKARPVLAIPTPRIDISKLHNNC
ncbi:uncharacterized protein A4U43_C04F22480 [Asparagus officinalis]|uniref:Cytochrome P450 n=1 Tax=Asparagus officinalis TaxID=4686 RepID=A0A5P1F3K1_ASPOF|nr:flavonoid 3'-monooxygenase-like [Asparagus officinalis]ONK72724.1 uncharacterized protein A4U43_C04F22480 [Asparagus officinalis]